jgi:hypothetical protein
MEAIPSRTWLKVIAGVFSFRPSSFDVEEPVRKETQGLMVVPSRPIAHLVIGEARLAFGSLNTFLNAVFGLCCAGEFREWCRCVRVAQTVERHRRTACPISERPMDQRQ